MKVLAYIVLAGVILSLVQSTIIAAALLLAVMILWGAFFRPEALFGLLAFGLFASTLERYPLATLSALALFAAIDAARGRHG
ncbi:hypothetical protein KZX46_20865 [Polymorphobacter sp. PAMC 29334]|uniref:hypothetical protein n=1 Tax=Polymorphobacter sp. PAMC 29334 TaxID=2862331 RepID=UPI001C75DB1E|nr:hypothetical protein [Polymorphobacter sp. PAMC 29334]QYE35131.1 hypothetical protein KZX46_20865 [Polymorphobacter sp. PAMC 29334]